MVIDDNGMKRDNVVPMYHKLPVKPLIRVVMALTEGSMKYDEGKIYSGNWEKANEHSGAANFDHLAHHLFMFLSGDTSEDHLAHLVADALFAMDYEERGIFNPSTAVEPEIRPAYLVDEPDEIEFENEEEEQLKIEFEEPPQEKLELKKEDPLTSDKPNLWKKLLSISK